MIFMAGNEYVIDSSKDLNEENDFDEIEQKIIHVLETKVKPAVANDGGDIKFLEFKNGIVKVKLQGSCSGCPSANYSKTRSSKSA